MKSSTIQDSVKCSVYYVLTAGVDEHELDETWMKTYYISINDRYIFNTNSTLVGNN